MRGKRIDRIHTIHRIDVLGGRDLSGIATAAGARRSSPADTAFLVTAMRLPRRSIL
jgi:hypothetical protein